MEINYKSFCHYMADNIMEFEKNFEWNSEDWNHSYEAFRDYLKRISERWRKGMTNEGLIEDFAKEFYQEASPVTHRYWLKGHNGLDELIKEERIRVSEDPGRGISEQDFLYHGDWYER